MPTSAIKTKEKGTGNRAVQLQFDRLLLAVIRILGTGHRISLSKYSVTGSISFSLMYENRLKIFVGVLI
jgi:hypothetical protein